MRQHWAGSPSNSFEIRIRNFTSHLIDWFINLSQKFFSETDSIMHIIWGHSNGITSALKFWAANLRKPRWVVLHGTPFTKIPVVSWPCPCAVVLWVFKISMVRCWINSTGTVGDHYIYTARQSRAFNLPKPKKRMKSYLLLSSLAGIPLFALASKKHPQALRYGKRADCRYISVVSGDGCASLATKCGITPAQFTSFNPQLSCSTLQVDQVI